MGLHRSHAPAHHGDLRIVEWDTMFDRVCVVLDRSSGDHLSARIGLERAIAFYRKLAHLAWSGFDDEVHTGKPERTGACESCRLNPNHIRIWIP